MKTKQTPIPPLSVVQLISNHWKDQRGTIFRIGYYSQQDGLDCVWLVNDDGVYEQTADQESILENFSILELSNETDLYGIDREALGRRLVPPSA